MLKHLLTIMFLGLACCASSQKSPNALKLLSRIKSVPEWYSKGYKPDDKGRGYKDVDSVYRAVAKMDSNAIIRFLGVLSDTTSTTIPNTCDGGHLTYGQLAFMLINEIEPVPYTLVTKSQWDTFGNCGTLPDGFLNYLKNNAKEFEERYWAYFNSQDRQHVLRETRKAKKKTRST